MHQWRGGSEHNKTKLPGTRRPERAAVKALLLHREPLKREGSVTK